MATPTLTKHVLPGALGEILIDVRAGGRSAPRPAALVLHGFKGFKDWGMFPPFAERLARGGVTVVTCNVSGSGVDDTGRFAWPERFGHNTFSAELADARAVLSALAAGELGVAPPTAIGLVGHSRGGGTALLTGSGDRRVRAVVTWAAISTVRRWTDEECAAWRAQGRQDVVNTRTGEVLPLYVDVLDDLERDADGRLDILGAAARLTAPLLVIHGTADPAVAIAEADRLVAAAPAGTERLTLEGAGHTFGAVHPWAGSTPDFDRVSDATIRWLGRHLA